jgi:hypothetical protein
MEGYVFKYFEIYSSIESPLCECRAFVWLKALYAKTKFLYAKPL